MCQIKTSRPSPCYHVTEVLILNHTIDIIVVFLFPEYNSNRNKPTCFDGSKDCICLELLIQFLTNTLVSCATIISGNPCCLTVQPTLDELHSYTNPGFKSTAQSRFLKANQQESQTPYSEFEGNRDEGKSQEESTVIPELFQGFLTIGTFGTETITNEPATPTFAMTPENTLEGNVEVTESDLKLFNYELERFLEAEKERFYESSGRNSHVSTITLSGKQTDGAEDEDNGNTSVCPLQGYLLGSSIEFPEAASEVKKERMSLQELFHRTKTTNESIIETEETEETQHKQTHRSSKHIVSKLLKKVHTSSKSGNTVANSASTNKKLSKVGH